MSYIDDVIESGFVTEMRRWKTASVRGDVKDKLGNPIEVGDRVYFNGSKGLVIGYVTAGSAGVLKTDYSKPYDPATYSFPPLPQHKWVYYGSVTVRVTHTEDANYGNVSVNVNACNVIVDNPDTP